MNNDINVYDFGAVGDGEHDDTRAIQSAIDEGYYTGRPVRLRPGQFSVGELILHPSSVLIADPQWGFAMENIGNAVLMQRFEDQECILDVSKANGATINGLSLTGNHMPGKCCGILSRKKDAGRMEDAYRIERTRAAAFAGHAVALYHVWCFVVRQSMFCFSGGDGLHMNGYDAFISDNWLSGNRGCGFGTEGENCSVTMTGNRIEWNRDGGIVIRGGSHYNLTGNYIDRSGQEGIALLTREDGGKKAYSNTVTCTGNVIYRSGKTAEKGRSAHLRMEQCLGVTVTGNSFCVGCDDGGQGEITPDTGIEMVGCRQCVVSNNTMFAGARQSLIEERENAETVISANPGSLYPEELLGHNEALPSTMAARKIFED